MGVAKGTECERGSGVGEAARRRGLDLLQGGRGRRGLVWGLCESELATMEIGFGSELLLIAPTVWTSAWKQNADLRRNCIPIFRRV